MFIVNSGYRTRYPYVASATRLHGELLPRIIRRGHAREASSLPPLAPQGVDEGLGDAPRVYHLEQGVRIEAAEDSASLWNRASASSGPAAV